MQVYTDVCLFLWCGNCLAQKDLDGVVMIPLAEHAAVFKSRNFFPAQPHFERYFLGMLSQFGRSAMRSRVGAAELDRTIYDAASRNLRMINTRERADCVGLRILEHFGVGTHRRPNEIVAIEDRPPLIGALRRDDAIDLGG